MIFYPDKFLRKALPKGFFTRNIITNELQLNKSLRKALLTSNAISPDITARDITLLVDKIIKSFKAKIKEGETIKDVLADQSLIENRIKNLVVYKEVQDLKEQNQGTYYRWLPSGAKVPDPEHQLLYGKIFKVGKGDKDGNMPGERYGCQCGMQFLTTKTG